MPNYSYQCVNPHCGEYFSVLKSIKDVEKREECPTCLTTGRRVYDVPNFVLK